MLTKIRAGPKLAPKYMHISMLRGILLSVPLAHCTVKNIRQNAGLEKWRRRVPTFFLGPSPKILALPGLQGGSCAGSKSRSGKKLAAVSKAIWLFLHPELSGLIS